MNNKKAQLVKLDGTIIRKDGSKTNSNYFKFLNLRPDDYPEITFTPEEAQRIHRHLCHLSTGSTAAAPMICGGHSKCFVAQAGRCPIVNLDLERRKENPTYKFRVPVGKQCPIETELLQNWLFQYIEEYQVSEDNITDLRMCSELAEVELRLWRLNNSLARPENAEMVQEVIVGIDKHGNQLTRQETSSIYSTIESLSNKRTKLIKLLVGDRQEKYKREAALKIKESGDVSTLGADLRTQLDKVKKEMQLLIDRTAIAESKLIPEKTTDEDQPLSPEDLIDSIIGE